MYNRGRNLFARKDPSVLNVGDRAPDFSALDHTGNEVKLSDLRGSKVWLWFYTSPGGKT